MKLLSRNWGQWTDLSTTGYMGYKYVLQARRHKNGKLQYRVEKSEDSYTCTIPTLEQLEKVTFKQQEQCKCGKPKVGGYSCQRTDCNQTFKQQEQ